MDQEENQDLEQQIEQTVENIPEDEKLDKLFSLELKTFDLEEFQNLYGIIRKNLEAKKIYAVFSEPIRYLF